MQISTRTGVVQAMVVLPLYVWELIIGPLAASAESQEPGGASGREAEEDWGR
jgi:hypothetical protein